jgi:hypothetical protein
VLRRSAKASKYFPREDIFETLKARRPGKIPAHDYTYSTGCVYQGEWFGGFRHGKGKCSWPDGCIYSGSWQFGFPSGQGDFQFKDGEAFSGNWLNPFATLTNRSCLEDILKGKRDGFGIS